MEDGLGKLKSGSVESHNTYLGSVLVLFTSISSYPRTQRFYTFITAKIPRYALGSDVAKHLGSQFGFVPFTAKSLERHPLSSIASFSLCWILRMCLQDELQRFF